MHSILLRAIGGVILTFAAVLALMRATWITPPVVDLVVACLAACMAMVFLYIQPLRVMRRRKLIGERWGGTPENLGISAKDFEVVRYRIEQDDRVLAVRRQHRIVLIPYYFMLFVGLVLAAVTVFTALTVSEPLWWLPLLACASVFYKAAVRKQKWKWTLRIVTVSWFMAYSEQPTYFSWIGKSFSPIPVRQILQCNDTAGWLGGWLGYGDVVLEIRADRAQDQSREEVVRFVGDEGWFAATLRSVLPAYTESGGKDDFGG